MLQFLTNLNTGDFSSATKILEVNEGACMLIDAYLAMATALPFFFLQYIVIYSFTTSGLC